MRYASRMAKTTGGDVILELMATSAELKTKMKQQSERVSELSADMKRNVALFARLSKLLGAYAKITDEKFDEVDDRLDRLEAASGK